MATPAVKSEATAGAMSPLPVIRPTRWANRLTLLGMLIYVARISDLVPAVGNLQLGKVLIGAALIALIFEGGGWWQGLFHHPVVRAFLGIVAIALVTAPFGVWPGNSVGYILEGLSKDVIFMFLLIVTTTSYRVLRRAIWMYAISAAIVGYALDIYGIQEITQFHLGKNETAMLAVLSMCLLLPLDVKGVGRMVKGAIIGFLVATVLFSGSRGSYLGLAVIVAVFMYLQVGRKLAVTFVALSTIGYVVYSQLPSDITGNVESIVNYQQDYNMTAPEGRIAVWKRGLTMIEEHPLTGVGINNFPVAEGLMHRTVVGEPWMNAHNSFIQVAAEIGLLGFVLFIVMLKRMYAVSRRLLASGENSATGRIGFALFLSFVGYLVTGFFLHAAFTSIFYVLIALHVSADRIAALNRGAPDVISHKDS